MKLSSKHLASVMIAALTNRPGCAVFRGTGARCRAFRHHSKLYGAQTGLMQLDFERLFDALPSPHMVLDPDFNFVAVNPAYETATQRSRGELLGRNLFDVFPNDGEGGQLLRASFRRVFDTGKPDTLAYIRYDLARPGGGLEERFWTAVHMPLADEHGTVGHLLQNTVDVTDLVRLREAASLPFRLAETRLLERAREAEEQRRALLDESADFRRLFQQAPGFFAVLCGPDHVFTFTNDAYMRLIGRRQVIGKPIREALPDLAGQGFYELLDGVYQTGQSTGGEAVRLVMRNAPDEPPREIFVDFSYDAIRDRDDGRITGVFVQGMDRTEAVRTQRRQRLLLDELNHRVKNTLATVQSIASQTLRSARDLASGRADFEARILALSNAHNLLSAQEWASAELAEVISGTFSAFDPARLDIDGPRVTLAPKASISLALVMHELCTNASKYGALSCERGTVRIRWWIEDGGSGPLMIEWTERGGPPTRQPERRGFGSRMIGGVVTGELGGAFDAAYDREGFSCRIKVPEDALVQD